MNDDETIAYDNEQFVPVGTATFVVALLSQGYLLDSLAPYFICSTMAADPITLAARRLSTKTDRVLQAAPYSRPEADQLVVHNHALAINPVDWMTQPKRLRSG